MGTKYTTTGTLSAAGYNSAAPADDGSTVATNKGKWETHLVKIGNPIANTVSTINSQMVDYVDVACDATKTGTYNLDADDDRRLVLCNGTFSVTADAAATLGSGWKCSVKNIGTGTITIDPNGSETIDGASTLVIAGQYGTVTLRSDGSNIHTEGGDTLAIHKGKHAIPIPAAAMRPAETNGCALPVTRETATQSVNYATLDFQTSPDDEYAYFVLPMPDIWDEDTVTFQPYWTALSGSGTVAWALQGVAVSNDDPIDAAYGTAVTSIDTLLLAGDCHIGPESNDITIAGSPAAGDLVCFRISRDVSADSLGVDANLIAIRLFITVDGATE